MVPTCVRCDAPLVSDEAPCVQCVLSSAIPSDGNEATSADSSTLSSAPTRRLSELDQGTDDEGPGSILEPNMTIGAYVVEEAVGRGGMGRVFRARHQRLDRLVALKVLPANVSDDEDRRRRFLHEARTSSALQHPNIVTVHDLIEHEGHDVIVMELVRGVTLARTLRAGRLEQERVLEIAIQIADALAAAHDAGIVHRDLKPANVMLWGADRVKLLDFGLAKEIAPAGPEDETRSALTQAGMILGTAPYMSPEQIRGRPVSAASDVFSFGSLLHEMLSGKRAFHADDPVELMHQICYTDLPPLFDGEPGERHSIGADVDTLLRDLTIRDPADRTTTMADSRDRLRALRHEASTGSGWVSATAPPTGLSAAADEQQSPEPRPAGRSRSARISAGLGAVALVVALIALGRGIGDNETGGASTTTAAPYDLFVEGRGFLDAFYREGYQDLAIERLEAAVSGAPERAPYRAALAEAYWRQYLISRDPIWLDRSRAEATRAVETDASVVGGHVALGRVYREQRDEENARTAFRAALDLEPKNAKALTEMARVEEMAGNAETAEALFQAALEELPDDSYLLDSYGAFLYSQARYEEAATIFEHAAESAPEYGSALRNLAATYWALGRTEEAATYLQRSLEIRADPDTYSNLGTLYFFEGKMTEAIRAYESAVDLAPNTYEYWNNLGDACRWSTDQRDKAPAAFRRASQILEQELGDFPDDETRRSRLLLVYAKLDDGNSAGRVLEELQSGAGALDSATHYRVATSHELLGNRAAAIEHLRQALEAGYGAASVRSDPELTELRNDRRYHEMLAELGTD